MGCLDTRSSRRTIVGRSDKPACHHRTPASTGPLSPESTHGLAAAQAALDARRLGRGARRHSKPCRPPSASSPEALEGLGLAAWWLDLADVVFDVRERAYRAYRERGDRRWRGAHGRLARLGYRRVPRRAGRSPTAGCSARRRLLEGVPDAPEHAWLAARAGIWALLDDGDPHEALRLASEAVRVGQAHRGGRTTRWSAARVHGFARVTAGAVVEGLQELDEVNAAVLAGEMRDRVLIGLACCYLIAACERIHDYERATQWCDRLKAFCKKVGFRPLFAVCRTQYASVCMWRGAWEEAEHELTTASDELAACRPAMTGEGLVRLGELRRRQGKLDEAMALFERVGGHPLAVIGRASVMFDRGDSHRQRRSRRAAPPAPAGDQPHRAHRGAGAEGARLRRAGADRRSRGRRSPISTPSPRSRARRRCGRARSFAAGLVAARIGDARTARTHLEDAVDLFNASGAPFETGRARLELARVLGVLGRPDAGIDEARRAIDDLSRSAPASRSAAPAPSSTTCPPRRRRPSRTGRG